MANDALLLFLKRQTLCRGIFSFSELHSNQFFADVEQFENKQDILFIGV